MPVIVSVCVWGGCVCVCVCVCIKLPKETQVHVVLTDSENYVMSR